MSFTKQISPAVKAELALYEIEMNQGHYDKAFKFLENAHVLGQESTYWHVKVHLIMFRWAITTANWKEGLGQLMRIVGAATKTAIGLVPKGNTGGANVSPFKVMPLKPEHELTIMRAKSKV